MPASAGRPLRLGYKASAEQFPPAELLRYALLAEELGLSVTAYRVFDLVALGEGPMTAGRIAELSGLTTGAVTGVIDKLERAGLVRRASDPEDRRKVLVVPSTADRFTSSAGALEAMLGSFSPDEREVIARYQDLVLARLRDGVSDGLCH